MAEFRLTAEETERALAGERISRDGLTVVTDAAFRLMTDAYVLQEIRGGRFTVVPAEPEQ